MCQKYNKILKKENKGIVYTERRNHSRNQQPFFNLNLRLSGYDTKTIQICLKLLDRNT